MSLSRHLLRRLPPPIRTTSHSHFCTSSVAPPPERHQQEYQSPSSYINSWKPSRTPEEAAAHLAFLRRDYDRKVKVMRKAYIEEMELQRIEKLQKDEKKKEALRLANQERKAAKEAKKKAEAIERQAAQEEFRQLLMKERAEKLEYWRMREEKFQERKNEKHELLRRQSSMWVEESKLEEKILTALTDTTTL